MEKAIPIDQVLRHAPGVDGRITVEQLAYGLLTAGQSVALRVLSDLGADPAALADRFRPPPEPDTEPFTVESFISALGERNRVELTPEAQALVDRVRDEKDCTPSLLLALAEAGVVPVSPDEIRNQFEKWGVEPEPLFPPDIRKLNVLIAQARELKRRVVDAERYDYASTIRAREKAAMRRRAELLTEWAGEAELVAMVEEIENLRATVRRLRG
ncbi:Clp protease N-terminal domain-containing protein [Amycolatopsis sp. DG1A-15b]|uniref:Clp protease N-terminal domain-containing protein n=1 Tax=Amycolatopsis sp. DG1A-15b TaxID=3052846 RepID=UPI00255B7B61|nr:Clp protease N-terminal domain-containing protein [Amycolatopsis sp. DG1A-15b]WIX88374.1 Clp protease N-terminal domain-containing protein [Amycolatopsis sp. DG1A-15b]